MAERNDTTFRKLAALAFVGLLCGALAPPAAAYESALTLHVEDAIARPGGSLAFVIRAYASRPIGQGQVCFAARPAEEERGVREADGSALSTPIESPHDPIVFSQAGDAEVELTVTQDRPQRFVLRFDSPSGSVNVYAGLLAVVYFDVREDALPGSRYELMIDAGDTAITGRDGEPLRVDTIDGSLSIDRPAEPYKIAARTYDSPPGGTAWIGIHSFEPVQWAEGRIGIRYDPTVFSGPLEVYMDPRHGNAGFTHDVPTPGLLMIDFSSADRTLNRVPGEVLRIVAPVSDRARPMQRSTIEIDTGSSWIEGEDGRLLPLTLSGTEARVLPPTAQQARDHADPASAVVDGSGESTSR